MHEDQITSPCVGWPIGARLRFKRDAAVQPEFVHLRGTPVLVMSELKWERDNTWRQLVLAYGGRDSWERNGWALPAQLEPIPDETPRAESQTLAFSAA